MLHFKDINMKNYKSIYIALCLVLLLFSCKKLIEIGPPKTSLVNKVIFSTNEQATATIGGIYAGMRASGYASGAFNSVSSVAAMSADELTNYFAVYAPFYENQLTPLSSNLQGLYSDSYKYIYTANSILEGLSTSTGVTPPVKAQLEGEAYFLRAFNFFYLVNMFGDVPLLLGTDYQINQSLKRVSTAGVYQQIISDLTLAESLLAETYPTNARIRANKTVAQAMLARTYLYMKEWANAEKYASIVIGKSSIYNLVNYDAVFLSNSQEAIWQLEPTPGANATDGATFIPSSFTVVPNAIVLNNNFVLSGFDANDKRKENWIKNYTVGSNTYYYPFKYKIRTATTATEQSTVLRLSEQYLIRAEARINQGNTQTGLADLNIVRQRSLPNGTNANTVAPLVLILSKADALIAVEKERRSELFCEWGHRWFDLKRLDRADVVLSVVKPAWQSTDVLYPIPQLEMNNNPRITQNPGY
jgi:hypothetical protein